MSIQTNSPSTNLGTSVSADAIATTLGYADAATLTAAIDAGAPQALDTTDSPQFAGINLGHASDTTLTRVSAGVVAVEGVTLQSLLSSTNKLGLAAGGSNADLSATGGATHFLRQASAGAAVTVGAIAASDLPTGIDAAKLHDGSIGNSDLVCIKDLATTGGAGHFLKQNSVGGAITSEVPSATDSTKLALDGSNAMANRLQFSGTGTSAGAGVANIFRDANGYLRSNAAAAQFRDINGVEISGLAATYEVWTVPLLPAGNRISIAHGQLHNGGSTGQASLEAAASKFASLSAGDPSTAVSKLLVYGLSHATYPDAHQQFAPLTTRAASTAIALCPVATGDAAKVEISETTIDDCLAFVNAAGTVSLYDKIGGTVNASIVNSSSPAAGEYGVYISAGVLYFKGGSSYAGKMGSFSKVWKA